jgi:hypothetical protein
VIEPQRRIDDGMRELVNKEVIPLQNAGIIYPIANSEWVSLIHYNNNQAF